MSENIHTNPNNHHPRRPSGRPTVLDDFKRAKICGLIASGVSLKRAARSVGCDPATIRDEAQRNPAFRAELAQFRAEAETMPMKVLRDAAASGNWRAAAWWMQRVESGSGGRHSANVFGKREANRFVGDLIEILDRVVIHPLERRQLDELLTVAMPAVMRRSWEHRQTRRRLHEAMEALDHRNPTPAADPKRQTLTPSEQADLDARRFAIEASEEQLMERFRQATLRPETAKASEDATASISQNGRVAGVERSDPPAIGGAPQSKPNTHAKQASSNKGATPGNTPANPLQRAGKQQSPTNNGQQAHSERRQRRARQKQHRHLKPDTQQQRLAPPPMTTQQPPPSDSPPSGKLRGGFSLPPRGNVHRRFLPAIKKQRRSKAQRSPTQAKGPEFALAK